MKYFFELSKEHKNLPKKEVISCLKAEKIDYKIIEENEDLLMIATQTKEKKIKSLQNRLSLTFFIDRYLFSSINDLKKLELLSKKNPIKKKGSIAIRCKNRSKNIKSNDIIKTLAEIYTAKREVALDNPDIEIRALIRDEKIYVGLKISKIDRTQFENRKAHLRPFFSPISLHPKIARTLVNLSNVKKNDILLDPFCGTGGILLEAGLIDIKIIGSDIEEKMIKGCKKTFDFYDIDNYQLFNCDIGEIYRYIDEVDAVVTDFPYGKSTTTKGEDIYDLYKRSFYSISKVLKKNKKLVVGLNNPDFLSVGEDFFSLLEVYEYRVHRSLTRFFAIYRK